MPKTKRLPRVGPEGKKMIQRGRVIHPKAKNWTPQNWTWLDSKETDITQKGKDASNREILCGVDWLKLEAKGEAIRSQLKKYQGTILREL